MSSIRKRGKTWFLDVRIGEKRIRESLNTDWYSVKVRLVASYVVTVPANSEEEALREAYREPIPVGSLYDVDKTATICGPSCDEIVRRAEERSKARGQKRGVTFR